MAFIHYQKSKGNIDITKKSMLKILKLIMKKGITL